jgi:hypothetical protein
MALLIVLIGAGIGGLAFGFYDMHVESAARQRRAQVTPEAEQIRRLEEKVRFLITAIENYCDKPGCNIPARNSALAKLRWAADEAKK